MASPNSAVRADGARGTAVLTESEITLRFAPLRLLDRPVAEGPAVVPGARPARRRRLKGLDGLRAMAVLAVVVFHLDYRLLRGGFLGVDVFFVISGFLITYLLAAEILTSGALQLRAFYARRARRLLPAVAALLLVVTVAGTTVWRDQLPTLRGGVLSSLGYVTNWWLIADHQSYFVSSGRPPMTQHLWSLAIEEQFYLVWSVLVLAIVGLPFARHRVVDLERGVRRLGWVAGALAVASAAAMAILAEQADLPYGGSVSRVYFGSDTHSTGLFLGAAGGAAFALHRRRLRGGRVRPRLLALTDLLGLAAVLVVGYEMTVTDEFRPGLYRGGFLAFGLLVLVAIRCAVRPGSLFGRVLDIRPVRWIGQRSYSIYIWHWPIAVVTRPGLDVHGPVWLINTARLALILAVSALSYRFIELPLRSGQWRGWVQARRKRPVRGLEVVAVAAVLSIAGTFAVVGRPVSSWDGPVDTTQPQSPSAHETARSRTLAPVHHSTPTPRSATGPKARTCAPAAGEPRISAFGDSVLLGAGPTLRSRSKLHLDAIEGRQAYDVLNDIVRDAHRGKIAPNVVIHVGNNGIIAPGQLRATLQALAKCRRVVLLTDRVDRDWQDPNNATVKSMAGKFANVRVIDWYALSAGHPDWLYPDGLHLTPTGAEHYTALVLNALHAP